MGRLKVEHRMVFITVEGNCRQDAGMLGGEEGENPREHKDSGVWGAKRAEGAQKGPSPISYCRLSSSLGQSMTRAKEA